MPQIHPKRDLSSPMNGDSASFALVFIILVLSFASGCSADRNSHARPRGPYLNYTTHMADGHAFMEGRLDRCEVDVASGALVMSPTAEEQAVYLSPVFASPTSFSEAVLSWNIDASAGAGVAVEFRAAADHGQKWTRWLYLGDWGDMPDDIVRTVDDPQGWIDVDYFVSPRRFHIAQFRLRAMRRAAANDQAQDIRVHRMAVTLSDTHTDVDAEEYFDENTAAEAGKIDVPYRSQKAEDRFISGRICSPTSVTMVMAFRGVTHPTADVAARCFDETHDIYGNWPRCVQGAHSFGVPGFLTRFSTWKEVQTMIAHGQPVIISIKANRGELNNAPYSRTAGHLLVITGFDEHGDITVNDPAATDKDKGQVVYKREELTNVWLGHGGTAYILLPSGKKAGNGSRE